MLLSFRSTLAKIIVVALISSTALPSQAAKFRPAVGNFQIVSRGEVAGVAVGIAAAGAGIGVGIYFVVRHNRSLTGCASSGPNGLQLQSEGDHQSYALIGDIATVKPGDRVRVSGKKKKAAGGAQPFLVEKVSKDFGACKVQPVNP